MTKSRKKRNFFLLINSPHNLLFLAVRSLISSSNGNFVGSFSREKMVFILAQLSEMFTLLLLMFGKISFFASQCR